MSKSKIIKKKSVNFEPWEFFDDCVICQGMKQGRGQTVDDLKKLFDRANKKQGKGK